MNNRIRIILSVKSDVFADCYADTGVKPSAWKDHLQAYVRAGLKERYGSTIDGKRYTIETQWDGSEDEPDDDSAGAAPDIDVMVVVEELTADAWHDFVSKAGYRG